MRPMPDVCLDASHIDADRGEKASRDPKILSPIIPRIFFFICMKMSV